jgi:hypothetical protein
VSSSSSSEQQQQTAAVSRAVARRGPLREPNHAAFFCWNCTKQALAMLQTQNSVGAFRVDLFVTGTDPGTREG